jgi:hypothetical protein
MAKRECFNRSIKEFLELWVSISEFIILITIWTPEHSIYRYFLSRNIIRNEVRATTTNVLKPSASLSSYEGSRYAALFIISFSVDGSCSFLGFGNDSAFNYNHMLLSLLFYVYSYTGKIAGFELLY